MQPQTICPLQFQSTPPVKAPTKSGALLNLKLIISTPAARDGGDDDYRQPEDKKPDFNPRRP